MSRISSDVAGKLKHYVYVYVDPRDGKPFYVGKGCGNRVFAHLRRAEPGKAKMIRKLARAGLQPVLRILRWKLSKEQALIVEGAAIDLLGIDNLTNRVHGHGTRYGARTVEAIVAALGAKPAKIERPSILINIAKQFHYGMTTQELYDATRSAWKANPQKRNPEFALAVFQKVIREVYKIESWFPGGSTMRAADRDGRRKVERGRWEFVGRVADETVRRKYLGRSVADYVKDHARNPITYVACE